MITEISRLSLNCDIVSALNKFISNIAYYNKYRILFLILNNGDYYEDYVYILHLI
jgi:hypothetical protein